MKPHFTLSLFLTTFFHLVMAQESKVDHLRVFLIDGDTSGTNVRVSPNGEIKHVITNDTTHELYYFFEVSEYQNEWYHVKCLNSPQNSITGWMHRSVLGCILAAYSDTISIYTDSDCSHKTDASTTEQQVTIIKSIGASSKIKYINELGEQKFGWIKNRNLCGSPYTTCN